MTEKWRKEFGAAFDETVTLLEEFKKTGFAHKRVAEVRFEECDCPSWEGISEAEGVVTIDPSKHEPRRIAHEMGHGFHECLRRDFPQWWPSREGEGETVAETIRFFVELRMHAFTGKQWLPKAQHSTIIEACDYKLGGPTGFHAMLRNRWTVEQLLERKETLADVQFTPEYKTMMKQQEQQEIEVIRKKLRTRVVVVFRKGGRIKDERSYDSAADSLEEVRAVLMAIALPIHDTPIGPNLIGQGFTGLLPWETLDSSRAMTEEDKLRFRTPVRIADVLENDQTGITTIFFESV